MRAFVLMLVAAWIYPMALRCQDPESQPESGGTVAGWREDLDALAKGLKSLHVKPFHRVSEPEFDALVGSVAERISDLSDKGVLLEFCRITALLGDGHTQIDLRGASGKFRRLPVNFHTFSDGLFVVASLPGHEDLVGARIVRMGGAPVEKVLESMAPYIPHDNDPGLRHALPRFLVVDAFLEAAGAAAAEDAVELELVDRTGATRRAPVRFISASGPRAAWRSSFEILGVKPPLCLEDRGGANWFVEIPDARAVYFRYATCADLSGRPVKSLTVDILAAVDKAGFRRLVVDLRQNGGGNSALLGPLVGALAERQPPLEVRVLIGPATFSSAALNATELKARAGAILLGEPTGQRPNHMGEIRKFRLPRSGLDVWYSTKHFRRVPGDPEAIVPDIEVPVTAADWLGGRDPVLDKALGDLAR